MKIPWIVIADHRFLFRFIIIFINSSARVTIQSINLYSRLSRQRLTYALLFLAAWLGVVDLLFTAGVVLSLVGEAAFDLVAALGQPIPLKDGRFKGMAGSLVSVYSPKRIISKIWKKG